MKFIPSPSPISKDSVIAYLEKVRVAIKEEVKDLLPILEPLSKIPKLPGYAIGTILYQNGELMSYLEHSIWYVRRFILDGASDENVREVMAVFDHYPRIEGIEKVFSRKETALKIVAENADLFPESLTRMLENKFYREMKIPVRERITPWINGIMWQAYRDLNLPSC